MTDKNKHDEESTPALPRIATGNTELDSILGGGFPANSINVLMGEPGCGKTILAERLIFANARPGGRPILFLTTLSEPLDKVIRYLQQFKFYNEDRLADSIVYDSIGDELVEKGVASLLPRLKEAIIASKPQIIIIDSFKAIHDLCPSVPEMRRMLYEVAGLLTAYETTAFFLGEYSSEQIATYPEFAVADAIVELAREKRGTRDERFLRVLKLRGSSYLEGLHCFRITHNGLEVFPRLVSPTLPPSYKVSDERVQSGSEGLDRLFKGGIPRGRSVFLQGPSGSGKTTLSLQFVLEGVQNNEHCLYVSFEENPAQLAAQIRSLRGNHEGKREQFLHYLYVSPVELQIDSIITTIYDTIRRTGISRLVVDAVGDLLLAASDRERLLGYLYALTQHMAVHGVTSFFPYEAANAAAVDGRFSALADNIILLNIELRGAKAQRTIRVSKARGAEHDCDVHEVCISGRGVEVT